jgi:uracil-DNA glycosylase family 4
MLSPKRPEPVVLPHLVGRPQRCPNCPRRSPTITHSGNPKAPLVIVGESPGAQEAAKNAPFVGDSGELLKRAFPLDHEADCYYLTNAIQCLPPSKDKGKILAECSRACRGRLIDEIREHPREVILAIGNAALWSLTNDYSLKITQERGKRFKSPLASQGIIAAYHPSYVLRGGGSYKVFREDVRYAFSLLNDGKPRIPREFDYRVLEPTPKDLGFLIEQVGTHEAVGADTETSSLNPRQGRILCFGTNFGTDTTYIVRGKDVPYFASVFDVPNIKWIWHNGKFDLPWYRLLGINARCDEDTMLLSYALNEVGGIHDLETVARDLLGAPDYKDKLSPWVKTKSDSFELVPPEYLYKWRLAPDCGYTLQSWKILRERVRNDPHLDKLYTRLLIPASDMLADVEQRGFYVHREQLDGNVDYYMGNEKRGIVGVVPQLREEINVIVRGLGELDINPNSWQQVSYILYDVIGLTNKWHSKGTAEDILQGNVPDHPITHAILKYREVAKAYGTYVKGIYSRLDTNDGCIHSTYKIHGTRTGRLSSADPNLQNIPRDPRLRSTFGARPGHILLEFDLDQAELRCLGALSSDPHLCHIYESDGLSLHKEVSAALWGDDWRDRYARGETVGKTDPIFMVAYDEYMRTKALNFGIVYGREAPSIAEEFSVPLAEAERWVQKWYTRFPKAKEYIDSCRLAVVQGKSLVTPFGRKKRFGAVSATRVHSLQNEAANFPHQSCASDITLYTAIKVSKALQAIGAYIVNLVHDSLVVECPNDPQTIEEARRIVEPEMIKSPIEWGLTRIPFKTDCKMGTQWGLGNTLEPLLTTILPLD